MAWQHDELLYFGNTTNNRVESGHQYLKDVILQTASLADMFSKL